MLKPTNVSSFKETLSLSNTRFFSENDLVDNLIFEIDKNLMKLRISFFNVLNDIFK